MTYEYLDELFADREFAIDYVKASFEKFSSKQPHEIKYSAFGDWLGNETPSMFLKSEKKFLKNKPRSKSWMVYRYDKDGHVQSVSSYNLMNGEEKCDCTYYFFEKDGYNYAVPFLGEEDFPYPSHTFKYKYEGGKPAYVAFITSADLWLELYDPENESSEVWHYTPGLSGADKTAPIGQNNSPAKRFVERLNVKAQKLTDEMYEAWLLENMKNAKTKGKIYITIGEGFSSQYSVVLLANDEKGEHPISDELIFKFNAGYNKLLKKLTDISENVLDAETKNYTYIGFKDGDLEKIN